uniref:Uncharacterized protein n=1 Tax=viral metagenome TaxID=1070528 RepID=A0A6H1ZS19_9ZZZZ
MSEDRLSKEDIQSMIDDQVKALDESTALYEPDQYAGNILVDPVIIAALSHWWGKYKDRLIKPERLTMLGEKELEKTLELIFKADIGYDGRRLTKHKTKYGELTECVTCYEPTPMEYAREISYATVQHTKRELGE